MYSIPTTETRRTICTATHSAHQTEHVLPKDAVPIEWDGTAAPKPPEKTQTKTPTPPTTFEEFVENLPDWQKDMLANHTIINENELKKTLKTSCITVNDGGANKQNNIGSFGWVLANTTQIVAKGGGITRGFPISSFRSEAYGRMASLLFIINYSKYNNITYRTLQIDNYCDNIGLLLRQQAFNSASENSPSIFLKNDIDTTITLQQIEKQLSEVGIFYDQLIMGVGGGKRYLINDLKPEGDKTAFSYNLIRNTGINNLNL